MVNLCAVLLCCVFGASIAQAASQVRPEAHDHLQRRGWSPWLPRGVVVVGVALAGAVAWSHADERQNLERYRHLVETRCTQRCGPEMRAGFSDADLKRYERRGDIEQVVAFSLFAASGIAVIAGILAQMMNQRGTTMPPTGL